MEGKYSSYLQGLSHVFPSSPSPTNLIGPFAGDANITQLYYSVTANVNREVPAAMETYCFPFTL